MSWSTESWANIRPSVWCCAGLILAIGFTDLSTFDVQLFGQQSSISESSNPELDAARLSASEASQRYKTIRKLKESGAASDWDVRRADYQRKIALLKFGILEQPKKEEQYRLSAAKITAAFTAERLKTIQRLYDKRSVSKLDLRRSETDHQVAKLRLQQLQNGGSEKLYVFKIAVVKFELADAEHDSALRLYRKGAMSKSDYLSARERQRDADAKMKAAKKAMGAKARVIDRKT